MRAKPTASLLILMLCAGCSNPKKTWLTEETKALNEMADSMSKVTDPASYESVKPRLKELNDERRARKEKAMGKMNQTEKDAWWAEQKSLPEYPKYQEATARYLKERDRLTDIPDVGTRFATDMIAP